MSNSQFFLVTPPSPQSAAFRPQLMSLLDAVPVASVLLLPGDTNDEALRPTVEALRPVVQDRGIAFLIDGRPALAAQTGCDGVHTCPAGPPYGECRRVVGPQAIVGYSCRNNRHNAMVHAELGADYIVFGESNPSDEDTANTLELIEWWSELMEIPSVALDRLTNGNAREFAEAGADFLAIGPTLWDDPVTAVKEANRLAKYVDLI